MQCAPRELALAQSHLELRRDRARSGRTPSQAPSAHLAIAEPNAQRRRFDSSPIADPRATYDGFEDVDGCPDDPTPTATASPTRRTSASSSPRTRTATSTTTAAPISTTTPTASPTRSTSARTSPRTSTASRTRTAAPTRTTTATPSLDVDDCCPNTPGRRAATTPGCPKKNSLVVVTEKEIRITQQIQFEFNKATIRPGSFPILDEVVDVLKDNPKITPRGAGPHRQRGRRRLQHEALADARRLRACRTSSAHGIDAVAPRLQGLRHRTSRSCPTTSPSNRALNRRVQFIRTEASGH